MSSNFGGTVIGGIQDISALLPLLGTEQCEEHVGSALDKGFLYSAVTPVSIFGSLGIVRAAFNILVASLSIRRYRFLGAKKLNDGGFSSKGIVAPMIALDPENPKRFLAESRLEAMLADEHIENVEDLTIWWGPRIFWWNLMLVLCTVAFSAFGLLPYIIIILDSQHPTGRPLFPSGWGFPILRVLGSALCVNVAQFIIQMRVLVILKTRLLFVTIDRLAKVEDIDIASKINAEKYMEKERKHPWHSDVTSETCIWALERWISSKVAIDPEAASEKATIKPFYESEYKRHFDTMKRTIPFWLHPLLCLILLVGIVMTIGGYIGCFYLIQRPTNRSVGPVIWLALEALLSVARIIIWALNPSWDDSKGLVFELKLASHAPLITCNKFQKDIEDDGVAPVTRSNTFLEEVVAYKGPLPVFSWNDVALYYIFTAKDKSPPIIAFPTASIPHGVLYVVLFDYKEQTSRILFKKGNTFLIYICSLEFAPGNTTINVKVNLSEDGVTQLKTHSFTANTKFMEELTSHYDTIASLLQKRSRSNNLFGKTWALLQPEEDKEGNTQHADAVPESLTKEDKVYLRQGQLERRWRDLFKRLEEWTELYVALYIRELLQDVPVDLVFKADESVTLVQKYEANEVEYLLIEYRIYMERLLMSTAKKWDEFVEKNHSSMVDTVLKGTFVDNAEQHGEKIRKGKLEIRLTDEWKWLFDTEARAKEQNRRKRLDAQTTSTELRLQGRKYYDPMGETISKTWKALPERVIGLGPMRLPADLLSDVNPPPYPMIYNNPPPSGEESTANSLSGGSGDASQVGNNDEMNEIVNFKTEMENRLKQGDSDVSNMPNERPDAKKDVSDDFKLMKKRCWERVDLLVSRMNHQWDEFNDLSKDIRLSATLDESNILTADSHNEATYWSNPSLQERRRLMDRNQQYLELTDDSIAALGGPQNIVRALKRSQAFVVIDFVRSRQLTGDDVLQIVKDVKSITGVCWARQEKAEEIFEAVIANVGTCFEKEQLVCFYRNVHVTDYYRKGRPYLIFRYCGHSICTIIFRVHQERDHIITVNHCMTTSYAVVDIMLNDEALERTWGLPTSRTIDDFHKENILLPKRLLKVEGPNELTITLADTSPGSYWLSDLSLSVAPNLSTPADTQP